MGGGRQHVITVGFNSIPKGALQAPGSKPSAVRLAGHLSLDTRASARFLRTRLQCDWARLRCPAFYSFYSGVCRLLDDFILEFESCPSTSGTCVCLGQSYGHIIEDIPYLSSEQSKQIY